MSTYDVIVIGGGTMGSAAAWAISRRGLRVLVLERFEHVHPYGSHGGTTRIIRQAYAESPDYVPLVQRAESLWLGLQDETGTTFFHRTGGLDLARPGYGQARDARQAALVHGLPYEWIDGAEIRRRWPAWRLGDDWEACYSPQTGFLVVEPALRALAAVARRHGAELRVGEAARAWETDGDGVVVRTNGDAYRADQLVISAGAWSGEVLNVLKLPLTVIRKVVWWLAVEDPTLYLPDRFPVFISDGPGGVVYGLPLYGGPGLKIANHAGGQVVDPEHVDRQAHPEEKADVAQFAAAALRGVTDRVLDSTVCLYTMSPDRDFIVDRLPGWNRVAYAAGFSGHGFKFAPVIGELLADLALDSAAAPHPRFAARRFRPQ